MLDGPQQYDLPDDSVIVVYPIWDSTGVDEVATLTVVVHVTRTAGSSAVAKVIDTHEVPAFLATFGIMP